MSNVDGVSEVMIEQEPAGIAANIEPGNRLGWRSIATVVATASLLVAGCSSSEHHPAPAPNPCDIQAHASTTAPALPSPC